MARDMEPANQDVVVMARHDTAHSSLVQTQERRNTTETAETDRVGLQPVTGQQWAEAQKP